MLITNCFTVKIKRVISDLIGVLYFVFHCTYDDQLDRRNNILFPHTKMFNFSKFKLLAVMFTLLVANLITTYQKIMKKKTVKSWTVSISSVGLFRHGESWLDIVISPICISVRCHNFLLFAALVFFHTRKIKYVVDP